MKIFYLALSLFLLIAASLFLYEGKSLVCSKTDLNLLDVIELKQSASSGDTQSARYLYNHYTLCGDTARGDVWEMMLARSGDANIQYVLGKKLLRDGDIESGLEWIESSSNNNYPHATLALASYYEAGEYVEKDKKKALAYYELSAEQGAVSGMLYVSKVYLSLGVVEKAQFWAEKALDSTKHGSTYSLEAKRILDEISAIE